MIDLTKTTFIIPLMIESDDRYRNAKILLTYLNHNFNTNIIIYEIIDIESKIDFLEKLTNLNIKLICKKNEGYFHRTKYLNIMLDMVETPVVVNYDVDVLIPLQDYFNAQSLILNGVCDVVYPFGNNNNQIRLYDVIIDDKFYKNPSIENLYYTHKNRMFSDAGFCIFFNTDVYKNGGGENENFISYGPEDTERYYRFNTLGYRIERFKNNNICHLEHIRTKDSNRTNPFFEHNSNIFKKIKEMDKIQLENYLKEQEYLKKYNFIKKITM